jgi:hypothetical protein
MALTVTLKPALLQDKEQIYSALVQAKVDVFSEGFSIMELIDGSYKIHFPKEPSNWRQILSQYGQIAE